MPHHAGLHRVQWAKLRRAESGRAIQFDSNCCINFEHKKPLTNLRANG
ncbi:hypothetical protein KKY_2938 [Pelagibacterium halotolerans B2]|uniref:Uncharacterized protein n=1 Tax=Pelagibacterium halotolerans (strain DSM 22347 / JCM 15775 / CGMCC 1.7692 / B2) TaxID=1082931 RepID=G4RF00_PELHB|nr:hypothetical protein KKY_2938 [Pelagibacterium halotolerans B2]